MPWLWKKLAVSRAARLEASPAGGRGSPLAAGLISAARQVEIAGLPMGLDLEAWQSRCRVEPPRRSAGADRVVGWFWGFVASLDAADRRRVLALVTEREVLPARGDVMTLRLVESWGDGAFPRAAVCVQELSLPVYTSPEALRAGMEQAMAQHDVYTRL